MRGTLAFCASIAAVCSLSVATSAADGNLPKPSGSVLLTISGHIAHGNDGTRARFDLAMLSQVGTNRLSTSTPWTDGIHQFEGVLARDLLANVGADGQNVRATGLNDYFVDIPISDFMRYPVLVAYKMDGANIPVRNGGPLWIIYPRDQYPELATPNISAREIAQLSSLDVR